MFRDIFIYFLRTLRAILHFETTEVIIVDSA